MAPFLMVDVCAGLAGASQAMTPPMWDVVTIDIDALQADIVADVRNYHYTGRRPDLIGARPLARVQP